MFVVITRGRWHTNQVEPPPAPRVGYYHEFYYVSQESCQPVSALSYRVRWSLQPALRKLGVWEKFCGPNRNFSTKSDTSVLWFGCRATNKVDLEDVILVSDQGLEVPLGPWIEDYLTVRSEALITWQLPLLLTNRGKYRLMKSNRTLVTFDYE
jgi:hypothetical protein